MCVKEMVSKSLRLTKKIKRNDSMAKEEWWSGVVAYWTTEALVEKSEGNTGKGAIRG